MAKNLPPQGWRREKVRERPDPRPERRNKDSSLLLKLPEIQTLQACWFLQSCILHCHTHTCYSCLTKYSVQWPNRSTLPLNTTWAVCVCWWSFTAKKLKWKVCLVLKINRFVRLILLKVTKYKKFVLLIFILDFRNRFKEIWREHISLICRLNEHQKSFRLLLSCLQSEKFNQL